MRSPGICHEVDPEPTFYDGKSESESSTRRGAKWEEETRIIPSSPNNEANDLQFKGSAPIVVIDSTSPFVKLQNIDLFSSAAMRYLLSTSQLIDFLTCISSQVIQN